MIIWMISIDLNAQQNYKHVHFTVGWGLRGHLIHITAFFKFILRLKVTKKQQCDYFGQHDLG